MWACSEKEQPGLRSFPEEQKGLVIGGVKERVGWLFVQGSLLSLERRQVRSVQPAGQARPAFLGGARWVVGSGETRPVTLQRVLQAWWEPTFRSS